jgi:LCP family protein required for cell wall assembly
VLQRSQPNRSNQQLPYFIASLGVGVLLIAGGIALRARQNQVVELAIAATQTASITDTPSATPTETLTPTPSDTPTETLTPSITPTGVPSPTPTFTPTLTPSPTSVPAHLAKIDTGGYPTPSTPPPTAIPTPVDPIKVPDGVVNILLMGSDKRPDTGGYRTDTLIVVSINKKEGTVNMLSLPRDLYVYIPGWTMNRINTADARGSAVGWEGGGPGLIKETLLYNFGITIHHYARVDFSGFKGIVDAIGGIDVPVDCAIQGYRLREPRLGLEDFPTYDDYVAYTADLNSWEVYTLDVGVHHLDGYMALWYARVRQGSTDFDRARRQQQVLRAIWAQAQTLGLLAHAPELWQQYGDLVETDMGLGNLLQLAPVAADLDTSRIRSYIITPDLLTAWIEPGTGANVFIPNAGAVERIVSLAMQPPAENYVIANTATVEVRNGTSGERLDEVAADRLGWEGLLTIPTGPAPEGDGFGKTVIYDFTGRSKTSQLRTLQRILHVADSEVFVQPDPNRVVDYIVILGEDYRSCTYQMQEPLIPVTQTPTPTP